MTEINQKFDNLKFIIKRKQCQVNFLEIDLINNQITKEKILIKNLQKTKLKIKTAELNPEVLEK